MAVIDVVAWITIRGRRLLVVRTKRRDRFYLPGGKPEPGETDAVALRREIGEELGVELDIASIVAVTTVLDVAHGCSDGRRVRMRCYRAEASGEARPQGELAEAAWIGTRERARCAPAAQQVLDELSRRGLIS